MRALVLTVGYSVKASYYDDWLDAFMAHPGLAVEPVNLFVAEERAGLAARVRGADLIVILHSGTADTLDYVRKVEKALLARACPLVVFIGNEFNRPWMPFEETRAWLAHVRAEWVATQLLAETGAWLYEGTGARVLSVPHALNPAAFFPDRPRGARRIDIGCRSFPYPIYLGNDQRNALFRQIAGSPAARGLTVDISTSQRLDRAGWAAFLNDCRFTVATEAGSPFLDRDDALAFAIRDFIRSRRKGLAVSPTNPARYLVRLLPWALRERLYKAVGRLGIRHEAIEDDPEIAGEVFARFFAGRASSPHHGCCISSRHFDAIGCGTVQLLVEGRYNDILKPDVHYVPIRPDFSNLDAVLEQVAEPDFGAAIAGAALEHCLAHHTHRHRIAALLEAVVGQG